MLGGVKLGREGLAPSIEFRGLRAAIGQGGELRIGFADLRSERIDLLPQGIDCAVCLCELAIRFCAAYGLRSGLLLRIQLSKCFGALGLF